MSADTEQKVQHTEFEIQKIIEYKARKELKTLMWERHPHCYLCSRKISRVTKATINHYMPRDQGGTHNVANLELCCGRCNSMKDNLAPEKFLAVLETMVESMRFRLGAGGAT